MNITFKHDLPVSQTMVFENLFPVNLRLSLDYKRKLMKQQAVRVYMFVNGELAGEAYGMRLKDADEQLEGCSKYNGNTVYCYSTAILRKFQGHGLSKVLSVYFNGLVFGKGFTLIVGHATTDGMLAVVRSFGAEIVETFDRWYDTNRTAFLYELRCP